MRLPTAPSSRRRASNLYVRNIATFGALLSIATASTVPSYVTDYAPIIWLHSDDPYMPSDILTHVLHTTPRLGSAAIPDLPPTLHLDLSNLASLNAYGTSGAGVYLTANDDPAAVPMPAWLFGETPDATTGALANATACAVVMVQRPPAGLDAFYFYFYSFNEGGDILQVLPPLDGLFSDAIPGDHLGDHVGDWEHNMVRFDAGEPVGIYFSAHTGGSACEWDDASCLTLRPADGRPVVFSARGSHANYASAGVHVHDAALVDLADQGRLWDPVAPASAYFYYYDPAIDVLTPSDPPDAPTDWFHFAGAWGDAQYADDDSRQETVRYFGLKKYESGPQGPKFKHLVRKGLVPDEKPKSSLLKILVTWYMGWYGCCLRGWNPWIVVVALVLVLVVLICVLVLAVRVMTPGARRLLGVLKDRIQRRKRPKRETLDSQLHLRLLDRAESLGNDDEDDDDDGDGDP